MPQPGGSELLGFLLSGSIITATVVYVLPWLLFESDTEPARNAGTRE